MLLRFWGTRGSIATPGPSTNRFGGNTSCCEVVTRAGQRFIFDCGTGARVLGANLMTKPQPTKATILLSHTHWDHIQGFPFFTPLFVPGNEFNVYGPKGSNASLPEVLSGQMEYTYFPVELSQLGAKIQYHELGEGVHDMGGVRVSTQFLNHPAIAVGYKIEADGVTLCYLCDHEPYWEGLWRSDAEPFRMESILHDGDKRHAEFMKDADVVVHDAQYTPEEYPVKKNWGHSTYAYVAGIASAANVRRLFLTHHDPVHDDRFLDRVEERARDIAATAGAPLNISCAREGYEEMFERKASGAKLEITTFEPATRRSLAVLVIDDDEDLRLLAKTALTRAGHQVLEADSGEKGLAMIDRDRPDLVVLDLFMPEMDGYEVLRRIRANDRSHLLPVIVLTADAEEESARSSFEHGATDFLQKPFTPPQLDARVRACFAHAPRA